MRNVIVAGTFAGGEIEPGTFHGLVMVDPKHEDRTKPGTDDTNSQAPAESEDA